MHVLIAAACFSFSLHISISLPITLNNPQPEGRLEMPIMAPVSPKPSTKFMRLIRMVQNETVQPQMRDNVEGELLTYCILGDRDI